MLSTSARFSLRPLHRQPSYAPIFTSAEGLEVSPLSEQDWENFVLQRVPMSMSSSAESRFQSHQQSPYSSLLPSYGGGTEGLEVRSSNEQNWRDSSDSQMNPLHPEEFPPTKSRSTRFWPRLCSVQERVRRKIVDITSRLPTGWRFGAWISIFQACAVLLINIIILVFSAMRAGWSAIGIVFEGDCDTVARYSVGIHLVINTLSTLLLSASNYMMQTLCAPTRTEVDTAHERGIWLDIGLQSIRNLKYMSHRKRRLWITLSFSSIPLHLFYNSSFFSTLSSLGYTVSPAMGPELGSLLPNAEGKYNWRCGFLGCPGIRVQEAELSQWDVLSASKCIQAYATDYISDRSSVILVVGDYVSNGTLIAAGDASLGGSFTSDPYHWICSGMDSPPLNFCSSGWRSIEPLNWKYKPSNASDSSSTRQGVVRIRYCLSQPAVPKCQLNFNLPLLALVIVFNAIKIVCMAFTVINVRDNALVTIGDAIASFTRDPDVHTHDMCLVSSSHFNGQKTGKKFAPLSLEYRPQRLRWLHAVSMRHLISTVSLFAGAIALILGLFIYAVSALKTYWKITGFSPLWQFGLGKPHSENTITGWAIGRMSGYGALLASVLISNTPQIILSMIYLIFNSLCTKMFLVREWSLYANARKPLRVSSPRGHQRSTYFLQIPYRFGLPLITFSALLHWLTSQSIFLVQLTYQNDVDDPTPTTTTTTTTTSGCGYSPVGMILTVIVGTALLLGVLSMGLFTHLNGEMPLAGSCSAAISASCHPPADSSDPLRPMKWGAVLGAEDSTGHVCFASGAVFQPIPGCYYS